MRRILTLVLIGLFINSFAYAVGDSGGVIRTTEYVVNDVWDDTNDAVRVAPGTSIVGGYKTTKAINGQVLTADTTVVKAVIISVLPSNTGNVYIGGNSLITSDNCMLLTKDSVGVGQVKLEVDSMTDIYVTTQRQDEGVGFIGIVK